MDIEDDIGRIFDDGQGDEDLAQLRAAHPFFAISRSRAGWFAKPTWRTDGDLQAHTSTELVEQMTQMVAEYRLSLLTRNQDGWGWHDETGDAWTGH